VSQQYIDEISRDWQTGHIQRNVSYLFLSVHQTMKETLCDGNTVTSRGQIWHILNIASSFSATLFWPNFQ
jgi:ABC-type oligopeptide transport system ATPase subunit